MFTTLYSKLSQIQLAIDGRAGSDLRTYKFFFQSRGYTVIKSALSGLRQILPIESPLKMMRNAFHFTLKVFFFVEIFKLLS